MTGVTKLEAYAYKGGGGSAGNWLYFSCNGGAEIIQPDRETSNGSAWQDISACLPNGGDITSIKTRYSQEGSGQSSVFAYRYTNASGSFLIGEQTKVVSTDVSAKTIIVDGGTWTPNVDKVSTSSPKRGEGTIKTINGTAVTIEPFVNNCFKEDQFLVFKTPKVIEVTPLTDSIDSFNKSTNTLALSGGKDLNQLTNGDTIYMTDGTAPVNQDGYTLTTTDIESDFVFDYGSQTLSGKSAAAIFDGDPNTYVAFNINASSAGDALVTFDPPIPANKEFVFYQANTDLETNGSWPKFQGFRINGIDVDDERTYVDSDPSDTFRNGRKQVWNLEELGITQINSFDIYYTSSSNTANEYMFGFRADGALITDGNILLTFPGDVSTNPDLQYFEAG